jgi:hypothetical protein
MASLAWYALILGILVGSASRVYGDPTETGTVRVDTHGTFTGDGTGPSLDPAVQGTHPDHNVYATYTIYTVTDSKGKVTLDPSKKSEVTYTDKSDPSMPFTTPPIPVTGITVDPTGQVTSFTFSGKDWYDPNAKDAKEVVSTGLTGSITLDPKNKKKGSGWVKASYESKDGKTKQNISFTTTPLPPLGVKKSSAGAPFASDTKIPANKSIDYNAATGILSIHGDTIVGTPDAKDPILGAAVTFPSFKFMGVTLDGKLAVFWPTGNTPYMMAQGSNAFERSAIPFLFYYTAENQFFASLSDTALAGVSPGSPFYDPSLPNISSPFLNSLDDVMNPSSLDFDAQINLYISITPDANYLALTDNFTSSGLTGGYDMEYAADPTPEPSTLLLVACPLVAFWLTRHKFAA